MSQGVSHFPASQKENAGMAYWLDWHLLLVDDISYANEGLKEVQLRPLLSHVSCAFKEVQGSGDFLRMPSPPAFFA